MVGLLSMDEVWRRNQKTGPITMSELAGAGIGPQPMPMMPPAPARPAPAAQPAAAPARGGFLSGFLGPEGRDMRQRLAMALEGMTLNPNQGLIEAIRGDMEGRKQSEAVNRTAAWLEANGRPDLAEAVRGGVIDGASAFTVMNQKPEDNRTALMQNYEYALSMGMTPEQARQWVSSAPVVNVGGKVESAFETEAAKGQAAIFNAMIEGGNAAQAQLGQVAVIEELLNSGVGGTGDALKMAIQDNLGINVGAGGNAEALSAVISQLVPAQRPPGSGQMSDRDVQLFQRSLPQLINTPEGNQIITATMRGMAEFRRAQGQIATDVTLGKMTREEGLQALAALPDPMAAAVQLIRQRFPGVTTPTSTMSRDDAMRLLMQSGGDQ